MNPTDEDQTQVFSSGLKVCSNLKEKSQYVLF